MKHALAVVLFLTTTIAAGQPMSGTYPIGPGGSGVDSFPTILAAANALNARGLGGDVVFPIAVGVYSGPVAVRSVAGSRTYSTRFESEEMFSVMVDAGRNSYAFLVESTYNVTVQGVRFRNVRGAGSAYVRYADSDSGAMRACRVGDSAQFGVQLERADWFRLDSNRIDGPLTEADSRALDIRDCRFASVYRCSIIGAVNTGLYLTGGSDFSAYRVTSTVPAEAGIRLDNSVRARFGRCYVHGAPDYGIYAVGATKAFFDSVTTASPTVVAAYFERCDTLVYRIPMIAASPERGVWLRESKACTLEAVSVMGQPRMGFFIDHSPGTWTDSLQVMGIDSDTGCVMFVDSSPNSTFIKLQSIGNFRRGVVVRNSDRVQFHHLRLRGMLGETGIDVENCDGLRVGHCSLNVATGAAGTVGVRLRGGCSNDTLRGMTILAGTEYGIRADSTVDNLVIACDYLSGWTAEGILLEKSGSPSLYFNTIASPSASGVSGVHLSDVTGAVAKNNIIWNRGLDSSACYRIDGTFPFVPGATDYNDLYATGANGSTARVDNNWYPTLADWRGHSSSPDGHSIAEDPLFDSLGDYHIQAGSPCRNSGIAIAGIDTDLEGETRDSLPDIGADEYVPPAVAEGEFKIPDSRLQILPNPVTSGFAVLHWNPRILDPSAPVSLRVFDATGRCFLTQALGVGRGASSVNLDLRSLSAGVYLVRLTAGAGTATLKLVRN